MCENKDRELERKIINVLNEEIGSDLNKLFQMKQIYEETLAVQLNLKEKLCLISSEAPTKIQKTLQDVENFACQLDDLDKKFTELKDLVPTHLKDTNSFLKEINTHIENIDSLEQEKCYLDALKKVEDLSYKLQQSVQTNQDMEAVEVYNQLQEYSCLRYIVKCKHLSNYVNETVIFWFELLKEKLRKDFEETLKAIQWPLISTNQDVSQTPLSSDLMSKFQLQFQCLWKLSIPLKKMEEHRNASEHMVLSRFMPASLAIEELVTPLNKRFSYHFSGNRPTNRRDKPEWYLHQVLQWIGDHVKFIESHIQPFYGDNDAFGEFSRRLVQLAVEKLIKDSAFILEDEVILAHTIGQVLSFESKLRAQFNYPSSQPSALLILTQPQFFSRWIALEKVFAVEKMDVLLSEEKAWSSVNGVDDTEIDDVRLTECGEGFLQMLMAITDRYKILPQPGHKLQFLDLQLELLDEFRIRLLQLARLEKFQDMFTKMSPNICPILNTLGAIIDILNDWTDTLFFIQLHSYKTQTENVERQAAEATNSNETILLPWLRTQANLKTNAEEGSVFDGIIDLLKRMKEDLLRKVVDSVMLEVKAKSQPYRLDKWASLPNPDEFIQLSLSPTGSAMLQAVAIGLQWMRDSLAAPLFTEAWQRFAKLIDEFLFEELVLQRQFNQGGAAQLAYDIQQNLIPLFSQMTNKPENFFRELSDSCTILLLNRPITMLLLDTLAQAVHDEDDTSIKSIRSVTNGKQALKDQGIRKLKIDEALSVLRRKML